MKRLPALQRRAVRGFTLVELMVTIAIAAVLAAVAVPSFVDASLGWRLSTYANSVVSTTHIARSEAIKRNFKVTLCPSSNGSTCLDSGWEQGYMVYCMSDDAVTCKDGGATPLVLQRQAGMPAGWKMTEANGVSRVEFTPTGTGATAATFTLCRATPTAGSSERLVRISTTGRPSVTKTTTGVCT
ncbi:MAG TPA: GspH/FimT family protein [Telluria sp.]|nr:GspH/FimT family protein [Telluria sp.]